MRSIAVLFADGFEEIEAVSVVDVLRRASLPVLTVGVTGETATGSHGLALRTDRVLSGLTAEDLEMVVVPGGGNGVENLLQSGAAVELVRQAAEAGRWVCAICAGPRVLGRAGALRGKRYTCYPGAEADIDQGERVDGAAVVRDGRTITSAGPGTACAFAYALVDALGGDSEALRQAMLYAAFPDAPAV